MKQLKWLVLIYMLSFLSSCGSAQTIDIDEYVSLETYGIDGQGVAVATFDPHLMDYLLEATDLTLFEINEIYESLKLEEVDGLSNGDEYTPKVVSSNDYPLQLEMDDRPLEVQGLPQSMTLDEKTLSELLEVSFSGLSGGGRLVDYRLKSDDPFILDVQLTPHSPDQISVGDILVFDVETGSLFNESGYELKTDKLSIEVIDLASLVTDPTGLTSQDIDQLIEMGEKVILSTLESLDSLEIVNYSTGSNPLEQYSLDEFSTSELEMGELKLSHVSLILYYSSDEVTRLRPHNVSKLHLTFDTTFNTPDGMYEDIQMGVMKDTNLVSYDGEIELGVVEDYFIAAIQNRKGDIYRLAYDQSLKRNYSNVEYVDWSFE